MKGEPNYFKTGVFLIAGFILLAVVLIFFGAGRMLKPKIYFETYVDGTVQGVDVGSPVKFRGVQVGRISRIDFVFNEYGMGSGEGGRSDYVFLEMQVDVQIFRGMFTDDLNKVIDNAVKQGLRVMLQPQGITGLNFAELNYVAQPERSPPLKIWWTPKRHYIPSAPGTLTSMLDSVNRIMDTVNSLNVGDTLKDLNSVMGNFNNAIVKLQGNLDEMDLAKTGADLRKLIGEVHAKVAELPIKQLSADGLKLMQSVSATADRAQVLVNKIESSPVLDRKAMGGIVSDLQSTADNFRVLSESLRQKPSLILWGNPSGGAPDRRR